MAFKLIQLATMKTALDAKERFIVDVAGRPVGVLLDLATYERLREAAEDNCDLRACRAAKTRVAGEMARGKFAPLGLYRAKRLLKPK